MDSGYVVNSGPPLLLPLRALLPRSPLQTSGRYCAIGTKGGRLQALKLRLVRWKNSIPPDVGGFLGCLSEALSARWRLVLFFDEQPGGNATSCGTGKACFSGGTV